MLTDLIKTKHNSNPIIRQITLTGEIVQEYVYYVLGFVPADVLRLNKDVWFHVLNRDQIVRVEEILNYVLDKCERNKK